MDLSNLKTYPLSNRLSKVKLDDFAKAPQTGQGFATFLDSLPHLLAAEDLRRIVEAIIQAHRNQRPIIWGMGAHVIKCGLNPVLIQLMRQGLVSALAINGAGVVHDFELAIAGKTSEDVGPALAEGWFGMAAETGEHLNRMINSGVEQGLGLGESAGKGLAELNPSHLEYSLLGNAWQLDIPVTVHLAIGTDIFHIHPAADGAKLGQGSLTDFHRFASQVAQLEGGVFLNIGSAVILPEVFLKAISLVRNLGYKPERFTTVTMDFIRQYRPTQNVVQRPTAQGGKGYYLIGHHEIMLPLLAAAILEKIKSGGSSEAEPST